MAERKENIDQTTSQSTDNYDGWGFDLFPERRGTYKPNLKNILFQGRGNENLERIKCERKVAYCIKKSMYSTIFYINLKVLNIIKNNYESIFCI